MEKSVPWRPYVPLENIVYESTTNRLKVLKLDYTEQPIFFEFVKDKDQIPPPDVSVRKNSRYNRIGLVSTRLDKTPYCDYHYIRFTNNKPLDENIAKISDINYDFDNTTNGVHHISRQRLIHELNKVL